MAGPQMAHKVLPRRYRRRLATGCWLALACSAVSTLLPALVVRGWLYPAGSDEPHPRRHGSAVLSDCEDLDLGRRHVLQQSAAGAAAAAGLWLAEPEAAEAFRNDRILNAKKGYVPSIRAFYQKLEGLRDDLVLVVEMEPGNAESRQRFAARPALWYSGRDSALDGPLSLVDGFACSPLEQKVSGIALIARGRCTFVEKMQNAKAAGAKAVIVFDQKMSKQPLETQGKTGAVRSKGIATRDPGDALYGGVAITPMERGKTIMGYEKDQTVPSIDAAMIGLTNGTALVEAINSGVQPKILDVQASNFNDPEQGIERFIKKDLKKMLNEMEIYGNTMRVSKDDMGDPILKTMKLDREAFANAVRSKDYGEIQRTFKAWNDNLDKLGKWDLEEMY